MAAPDTKEQILDAAEALLAEQGYDRTSLRAVTRAAGVNLAAVNYHFGSKDGLVQAVFARRVGPLNHERLRQLDLLEQAETTPTLEQLLEAFIQPALHLDLGPEGEGVVLVRLLGRLHSDSDPEFRRWMYEELFSEVKQRFTIAFEKALTGLRPDEQFWRVNFTIGAMAHTLLHGSEIAWISGGLCDSTDRQEVLRQLIAFAAGGLRAPSAAKDGEDR